MGLISLGGERVGEVWGEEEGGNVYVFCVRGLRVDCGLGFRCWVLVGKVFDFDVIFPRLFL